MPEGGNWKDLLKAAGEGNRSVVELHLSAGVDPFFQHPEYFTAPIFEAIRQGQLEIVQLLLEYSSGEHTSGKNMLELREEMTDATPLEVAFAVQQHAIVNYILSLLLDNDNEEKQATSTRRNRPDYIKTIALLGLHGDEWTTLLQDLLHRMADAGHRVVAIVPAENDTSSRVRHETGIATIRKETGNPHVYAVLMGNDDDDDDADAAASTSTSTMHRMMDPIDVWIVKSDDPAAAVARIQESFPHPQSDPVTTSKMLGQQIVWCSSQTTPAAAVEDVLDPHFHKVVVYTPSWIRWLFSLVGLVSTPMDAAAIYRVAIMDDHRQRGGGADDAIHF